MKKICVLLLIAALLTACAPVEPTETTTEPTTQATTAPTTAPATIPTTETTESEPTVLDPEIWLTDPQYPTYEDFFSQQRCLSLRYALPTTWLASDGSACYLGSEGLVIKNSVCDASYEIPNADRYDGYNVVSIDGRHAYMHNETQIIQIDLLTGEIVVDIKLNYEILESNVYSGVALYYMGYDGEKVHFGRVYLPEMKHELLCSAETPLCMLQLTTPESTQGTICWQSINPEMVSLIQAELAKPDSKYQKIHKENGILDLSSLWEIENPLNDRRSEDMKWLCYELQEATGIRALIAYSYDSSTGTLSSRTGIIDNCFFGTGEPHDHFSPDIIELTEPVVVNGPWQPISAQIALPTDSKACEDGDYVIYSFGFSPDTLYSYADGIYTKLTEDAVVEYEHTENAIYYINQKNELIQLSCDGSVYNTLYTGKNILGDFAAYEDSLYIKDGNELVEIDLTQGLYRVLLSQEALSEIRIKTKNGKVLVHFFAHAGLVSAQYDYDIKTGTIESVTGME